MIPPAVVAALQQPRLLKKALEPSNTTSSLPLMTLLLSAPVGPYLCDVPGDIEAPFSHVGGSRSGADNMDAMSDTSFHTHSLGSKSTSSSGFLPGLGGCIVPFHPVRAVTVAKRREYRKPIKTLQAKKKLPG